PKTNQLLTHHRNPDRPCLAQVRRHTQSARGQAQSKTLRLQITSSELPIGFGQRLSSGAFSNSLLVSSEPTRLLDRSPAPMLRPSPKQAVRCPPFRVLTSA